jgi:type III pantothenate kinase
MTDWLLDLGNTRLKVAALEGDAPAAMHAFAHAELPAALGLLDGLRPGDRAWLASVGPDEVARNLEDMLLAAGLRVERVRTQAAEGKLRVAYEEPERLGVDRFLALLGASARTDGPWVVVSAGSALTADVLAADGRHLGGVIAPTAAHMQAMLGLRFPALDAALRAVRPRIAWPTPAAPTLGEDTLDGVVAGTRHAQGGLVERVLREAASRLGVAPTLLMTGGDASDFEDVAAVRRDIVPALVLQGLARYARARAG